MAILGNDYPFFIRKKYGMDIVDELRTFVATARSGSFTAAADQLGVSNRLTFNYVAGLESRLGVRLLQRTTRKVGLTPAGEELLARVPAFLDELDDLLADVRQGAEGFSGVVRVSAPVTFGEIHMGGMLGRFGARHPALTFDLRLHDEFVDLASEGIDVAFRIGQSGMLSLKSRKLGEMRSHLAASPAYIAEHGAPATPDDLAHHACILDTNRRAPRRWLFQENGNERVVEVHGRFQVNSARASVELATAGLGICHAPRFALHEALKAGSLVPLMEEYAGRPAPVSAVWLEGRTLPRRIRALIDFAVEDIRRTGVL